MEKKKSKKKGVTVCLLEGCSGRVVAMIGTCKWCNNNFCQEHRLPECHAGPGIESWKKAAFDINAAKNGAVKCNSSKMAELAENLLTTFLYISNCVAIQILVYM